MTRKYSNNIEYTLAVAIVSTGATSCTLSSGTDLPTLGAGDFFAITFDDGVNIEICYVTAYTGAVINTMTRGEEGTTASTFGVGTKAEIRTTKESFHGKQDKLDGLGTTNVSPASGDKILVQDVSDSGNLKNVYVSDIVALSPGVTDGDKGDITVSSSGAQWNIDTPSSVTLASNDKILLKDTSASDALGYVTVANLVKLQKDTAPILGGYLDVAGFKIGNYTAGGGIQLDTVDYVYSTANGLNLLPIASGSAPLLNLYENAANGSNYITLKAPANVTTNRSITLPQNGFTAGYFLQTDGSGVTSWASAALTDGDYGDITVSSSGTVLTIDTPSSITLSAADKVLLKDTSAGDVMGYATAQNIRDLTPSSPVSLTADVTGTLPIANGGTSVTSVTTTPTANAFAGWDASLNLATNNTLEGFISTVASGTTITLTAGSQKTLYLTGNTSQTVILPVVSTLNPGHTFLIYATGNPAVVQSSGANTIATLVTGTMGVFTSVLNTGTTAASWAFYAVPIASSFTGAGNVVRASSPFLTLNNATGLPIALYETAGTFAPTFTFATPGDLSMAYTTQTGVYRRTGNIVNISITIVFTPTFTTASGAARFSALPFAVGTTNTYLVVGGKSANITLNASDTQLEAIAVASTSYIQLRSFSTSSANADITTARFTSGAAHTLNISGIYFI